MAVRLLVALMLISLGESIVIIGATLTFLKVTAAVLAAFVVAFAGAVGTWGAHAVHPDAGSSGIGVPLVTSVPQTPREPRKHHRLMHDCYNMHVLG